MFHLDNETGVPVMPDLPPTQSNSAKWFTEGGNGVPPSWPGSTWFNIVQAEMLNVLAAAGIIPDKSKLNQLAAAINKLIANSSPDDVLKKSANLADLTDIPSARASLKLGTAAVRNAGTDSGQLMPVGSFGIGDYGVSLSPGYNIPAHIITNRGLVFSCGAADNYTNAPSSFNNQWFDILQMNHSYNQQTLLAISQGGKVAVGSTVNGEFQGWVDVLTNNTEITTPIGVPFPYPLSTVPENCLKLNNGRFDTSLYPKLAVFYPSGQLPDVRGDVIRAWDDGRGIDTGRALLSEQADAMQEISGTIIDVLASTTPSASGAFSITNTLAGFTDQTARVGKVLNLDFKASRSARTANETRSRNIAFNLLVRAR